MTYRNYLMSSDHDDIAECCRSTFNPDELLLLANDFNDPELFWEIMKENDKLIAFCGYGIADCSVDSWMIYWIGVEETERRSGNGTRILREVERNIRQSGGERIFLEATSKDESANAFYLKNGYKEAAVIKDYYSEGDDKIVYVKSRF
jgi:ribosomal protein S18 acetylase RimI-like enzyme